MVKVTYCLYVLIMVIVVNFQHWSIFSDGTGATIQKDGTLIIDHVVPHDGGNYTCSVTNNIADGGTKNFEHELIVITLPTYTIKENILYNMTAKCELTDVDIMNLYMPSKLRELLCGFQSKICSVHVQQPHCVKKVRYYIFTAQISFVF